MQCLSFCLISLPFSFTCPFLFQSVRLPSGEQSTHKVVQEKECYIGKSNVLKGLKKIWFVETTQRFTMREATTGHRIRGTEGKVDVIRKKQLSLFYFLHKGGESPTGKNHKIYRKIGKKNFSLLWC